MSVPRTRDVILDAAAHVLLREGADTFAVEVFYRFPFKRDLAEGLPHSTNRASG